MGILGLFWLDRDRKALTSRALWIPIIWIVLAGSRPVGQWLSDDPGLLATGYAASAAPSEGSPLERNIFIVLVLMSMFVLARRWEKAATVIRSNIPIVLLLTYCALSVFWSDYPGIAFKRWVKALGDFAMVMVVLTDPDVSFAVRRFLSRASFIVIPVSVLLCKYFPAMGMKFSPWDGTQTFIGTATDKNMLGMVCLVFGVAAAWRILEAVRERDVRPLVAHLVILAMVVWLFRKANSVTSMSCFAMAIGVMILTTVPVVGRKRPIIHLACLACLSVAFAVLFLHWGPGLVESMGRDPSITGRTGLWKELREMNSNQFLGAGFESFWMGPRLEHLWSLFIWQPNEAHNGYFEVFLNLGAVGVTLLLVVIIAGYRNALAMLRLNPEDGRIKIAYVLIGLAYSFTEAGFRVMSPTWICFMLAATAVPRSPALAAARSAVVKPFRRDGRPAPSFRSPGGAVREPRFVPARSLDRKSVSLR